MNRGARRNNRPRANAAGAVGRRITDLQRRVIGHQYKPNPDPTPFVLYPWNSWTFQIRGKVTATKSGGITTVTPYKTTIVDIASQIASANGMAAKPNVRVKRATSWATASSSGNSLAVPAITTGYFELAGVNPASSITVRETFSDKGTLNMSACTGYVFPITDQKEIFDGTSLDTATVMASTSDSAIFADLGDGDSAEVDVTHRVYVEWKAKNPLLTEFEK